MPRSAIAAACLALSGFAGLVYELCWIRRAALAFGSTTLAVSTVLAVFFGGMSLGSAWAGRRVGKMHAPMRGYAILEVGLALSALASGLGFRAADAAYGVIYAAVEDSASRALWLVPARLALVSLLLLPPAALMGATLPLACRQMVRRRVGASVAWLYAANTLGAAAGCAIAGLWLIPRYGVDWAMRAGIAANAASAAAAWLGRWPSPALLVEELAPTRRSARVASSLFFLTGFAVLGGEVVWTRFLALVVAQTSQSYTITIGVILLGIVIGAALSVRLGERGPHAFVFGALQIFTGTYLLAATSLPPDVWRAGPEALVVAALLLPPAISSGASFPIAVRLVVEHPALAGAGVGRMAAINTLGGIVGSLFVGFIAVPRWGLARSLHLTSAASVLAGVSAWLMLGKPFRGRVPAVVACVAAWLAVPQLWDVRLPADHLAPRATLIDFVEGRAADVAVVRHADVIELHIDRLWQGQSGKNHQIMAAHVPMLLHAAPRDVLVIGVGAGLTPSRVLLHEPATIDCVDIEPAVFGMIARHFDAAWMRDPRVRLVDEDGRNHLTHTARSYDVVAIEVGQLFRPGVSAFYAHELYRAARAHLRPGGVLSQFLPIAFLSPALLRDVLRTFIDVFPQSVLWYNTGELLLIGFHDDVQRPRLDALERGPIHDDLSYAHWGGPRYALRKREVFLGGLLLGPAGLASLAQGGALHRDDHPVLEGIAGDLGDERPIVALLRERRQDAATVLHLDDETDGAEVARIQQINLADLEAAALLRRVDLEAATPEVNLQLLSEAVALNPRHGRIHALLGEVYTRLSDAQAALAHLRAAVNIDPEDVQARKSYGYALHRSGDVAAAIVQYREVLLRRGDDAETHNNLGVALGAQGSLDGALFHFGEAVRLRPGYAEAQRNLEHARLARDGSRP